MFCFYFEEEINNKQKMAIEILKAKEDITSIRKGIGVTIAEVLEKEKGRYKRKVFVINKEGQILNGGLR